jgi:MoaA/NifB/PqqE/SkfB family radical SAM enzyme
MIPKIKAFHIEATNICTLRCSGCARTRFLEKWPQHWKNHSLDTEQLLAFLDVDINGVKFRLCGNYGDPIYHPNFINMIHELKKRGAFVCITTNGSYKSQDWWKQLCGILTDMDSIQFSIDGTPENFTKYRVNADWDSIENGIEVCVDLGIYTIWKYIPFDFNQQDIDRARSMAEKLKVSEFLLDPSDRYDSNTAHLIPAKNLLGWRKLARENNHGVNPRCYQGHDHFITATGHYVPCCFLADHRFYYKNIFGKNLDLFDIRTTTLTRILDRPQVIEFYSNIEHDPISACQYNCPKLS